MEGAGRAESGTEAESFVDTISQTQQTHQAAPPLPRCKMLGFATLYPTYRKFQTNLNNETCIIVNAAS